MEHGMRPMAGTVMELRDELTAAEERIAALEDELAINKNAYSTWYERCIAKDKHITELETALETIIGDVTYPYPESYWDNYPKYKARNDLVRKHLADAAAVLAAKEESDEKETD